MKGQIKQLNKYLQLIEGDDLIIKCEFQSKFQVKSTTWLFNGKDLEINSKDDKYASSLDKNSSSHKAILLTQRFHSNYLVLSEILNYIFHLKI
jgi:hypothetical protein